MALDVIATENFLTLLEKQYPHSSHCPQQCRQQYQVFRNLFLVLIAYDFETIISGEGLKNSCSYLYIYGHGRLFTKSYFYSQLGSSQSEAAIYVLFLNCVG